MSDDLFASIGTKVCSTLIYYVQGSEAFDKYMVGQKNVTMITHAKEDTIIPPPTLRKLASTDPEKTGPDEMICEKHEKELAVITDSESRTQIELRQAQAKKQKYNDKSACILKEIETRRDVITFYKSKMEEMTENEWETIPINDKSTVTKKQLQRLCAAYTSEIESLKKELGKVTRKRNGAIKEVQMQESLLDRMDSLVENIETNISSKRFVETIKAIDKVQQSIVGSMKAKDVEKMMVQQTKLYDDVHEVADILAAPIQTGQGMPEDYSSFDDEELDKMMAEHFITDGHYDHQLGSSSSSSVTQKKKTPTPYKQLQDTFATDTECTENPRKHKELPVPYTPPTPQPAGFSQVESNLLPSLFD